MRKPKGGAKGSQGVKGGSRGKGKTNAQNVYTAQERSQAYLVNAERVAAGLAPASIASICRSRRRSAARHANLHLSEIARRSEPIVPRPAPPAPPAPRRRVPPQEDRGEAEEGGAAPLEEAPLPTPESLVKEGNSWERRVKRRAERSSEPSNQFPVGVVLRSVSRSGSPSDKEGGVSRSPSPEESPQGDLARAIRGEAAPSRPAVPAPPDFSHLEVDRQSGSELVESSDEEPEKAVGGETSPSKVEAPAGWGLLYALHGRPWIPKEKA